MIKFFQNIPELFAVMSEREDGSMKLFKDIDLNLENRQKFFEKVGIDKNKVIAAEIVHGIKVEVVDKSSTKVISGADGIITKDKDVFLSITVADCIPVFMYESEAKIIAIAHCGWRGIVDGIIENMIVKILGTGGSVENMKVALGPGINECHFEIKDDVLDKFENYAEFIIKRDDKIFIDLKGIIRLQLKDCKISTENIEDNNKCTMESDRYFSYRRDKPVVTQAMVAIIGIKN